MSFNEKIIEEKIEQKVENLGYDLVKSGFYFGKKRNKIEIVVYSSRGIKHSDCAKITKEIMNDPELSEELGEDFILEVSSPGINRKLFTLREYKVFTGKKIEFSLKEDSIPKIGRIEGINGTQIILYSETDQKKIQTTLENIHYSKLLDGEE